MALTRRLRFGAPPKDALPSVNTVRLVPLTQGMKGDTAWPLLPPGSAVSMTNFLPLDGVLVPRSRLSSLNTINTTGSILGMAFRVSASGNSADVWLSGQTRHGLLTSNGSISLASFVSAFGFGTVPTSLGLFYSYAPTYSNTLDDTILVVAAMNANLSSDTLLTLYRNTAAGPPLFSYLTSAPRAQGVTAFDSYIVAFHVTGTGDFTTRVQWNVRGSPSNWTGEGSGYEDLLDMGGAGRAVRSLPDGRIILFSEREIWYGTRAAYPAQFQFAPLDREVGCPAPNTIALTEQGLVFLGSDRALHLLPKDGGPLRTIAPSLMPVLRHWDDLQTFGWGHYDPTTHIYTLGLDPVFEASSRQFAVNIGTGEWGHLFYASNNADQPRLGLTTLRPLATAIPAAGQALFCNSRGSVFSNNSLLATDSGSTVTATWQSAVIAPDLPGTYKQLQNINIDYRATSRSTVTLKISQDGGNNYEATGRSLSLASAPYAGRASVDVYSGGAFPTIELTSTSTGFELHRLDATLLLGGQR